MDGLGGPSSECFDSFAQSERIRSEPPFYGSSFQNSGVFCSLERSPAEFLGDRNSNSFCVCFEASSKARSMECNESLKFQASVGDERKNSCVVHSRILRIREEDSVIGEDIRWELPIPTSKEKFNRWKLSPLSSSSSSSHKRLQSDLQHSRNKKYKVWMAVITMGCNMQYETTNKRVYLCECNAKSSLNGPPRWHTCYLPMNASIPATKMKQKEPADDGESSYKGHLGLSTLKLASNRTVWLASESGTDRRQLRSLTSSFGMIQGDRNYQSLDPSMNERELIDAGESTSKTGLQSLDAYFKKLNGEFENDRPLTIDKQASERELVYSPMLGQFSRRDENAREKNIQESNPGISQQQDDEASNLYLISILASINIAVFLFEIASPIRTADPELLSLPLLYGGKVNDLIMVGEWWRLLTPMFLHSGFFHISLGCWALLTFGRRVCQGYGPFTFFLIYVLGGVSGNLMSFFHTPELTVGGTGPVFALIGAWLMHQLQNKDVISKEVTDDMFQKAIIATSISFVLSSEGPIDDWTHFGAAVTGIIYGFLTSPDEASLRSGQEEGMTLVRRYADPCKSLIWFTIFILAFTSLLLFLDPPLNTLASSTYF